MIPKMDSNLEPWYFLVLSVDLLRAIVREYPDGPPLEHYSAEKWKTVSNLILEFYQSYPKEVIPIDIPNKP